MSKAIEKYLGPEDLLQIEVCKYIRIQYPTVKIHHSPNEGKRGYVQQYKVRHMAVAAGFPDLFLVKPRGRFGSKIVVIELKAGKNKATPAQLEWVNLFNAIDVPAKVCTGFDQAKAFLDEHLNSG